MSPGDALRFQCHHFRLMGTRLLREDPSRRKPPVVQIPLNPDKHDIFKYQYPNVPPGVLCGSNDTIFASRGPVCSEKTPPDENHH